MKDLIILNGGNRSVLSRIIAAILYTLITYLTVAYIFEIPLILNDKILKFVLIDIIRINIFLLISAISLSAVISHHFNLKDQKYRQFYSIGPFGYGIWEKLQTLTYTATNHNSRDIYEVNIWDENNHRYRVGSFENLNDAQDSAKELAYEFDISYYDKENDKLIEIEEKN